MARTINGKTKISRSTSNPTAPGGKVVNMASPKSPKSADNSTKRTAMPMKSGKK